MPDMQRQHPPPQPTPTHTHLLFGSISFFCQSFNLQLSLRSFIDRSFHLISSFSRLFLHICVYFIPFISFFLSFSSHSFIYYPFIYFYLILSILALSYALNHLFTYLLIHLSIYSPIYLRFYSFFHSFLQQSKHRPPT